MESGAYGAANAGGSFDLRRFLSQPQVVTRLVSMPPRRPGPPGGTSWMSPMEMAKGRNWTSTFPMRIPRVRWAGPTVPSRQPAVRLTSAPCLVLQLSLCSCSCMEDTGRVEDHFENSLPEAVRTPSPHSVCTSESLQKRGSISHCLACPPCTVSLL
uniref:Predicted gene 20708 n=1 Tax=Mus musculus TaxID=10090 RepID=H3BKF4_MOUSE